MDRGIAGGLWVTFARTGPPGPVSERLAHHRADGAVPNQRAVRPFVVPLGGLLAAGDVAQALVQRSGPRVVGFYAKLRVRASAHADAPLGLLDEQRPDPARLQRAVHGGLVDRARVAALCIVDADLADRHSGRRARHQVLDIAKRGAAKLLAHGGDVARRPRP